MRVPSLGRGDLLEEEMASALLFLPDKSHGQRSLAGYTSEGSQSKLSTQSL